MGLKSFTDQNAIYFITATVVNWIDIFSRPVYKYIIIDSLKYCQKEKGLEIYAWVVMTNHIHLIVSAKPNHNISDIMRDFKKFTSKAIIESIQLENESRKDRMLNHFEFSAKLNSKNKYYKLWQDGNEPKIIYSNEFMMQKLLYIHNNPVKAEFVNYPEHYKFSSAIDYADGKGLLDVILV